MPWLPARFSYPDAVIVFDRNGFMAIVIILGVTSGIGGSRITRCVHHEREYISSGSCLYGDTTLTIFTNTSSQYLRADYYYFQYGYSCVNSVEPGWLFSALAYRRQLLPGRHAHGNARLTCSTRRGWPLPRPCLSILVFALICWRWAERCIGPRLRGGAGRYG